ncbi:MAG: TIGR02206 family membrane protein [Chthoniobacteraceae bacterium]
MTPFQFAALVFIAGLPALVWWWDRHPHRPAVARLAERGLAVALLLAYAGDLAAKWHDGKFTPEFALPMQLCDWALLAIVPALWWRWRAGFDVAYFWGLAATLQAVFTPAIAADLHWLRQSGFFFMHAGIVAGVLHLTVTARFRPRWPRSIVRVVVASEAYLACALTANALTGGNYGFLSHKPATRSMLDLFSDTPWLYVVQLNVVAFGFFAALYAPWWITDAAAATRARADRRGTERSAGDRPR